MHNSKLFRIPQCTKLQAVHNSAYILCGDVDTSILAAFFFAPNYISYIPRNTFSRLGIGTIFARLIVLEKESHFCGPDNETLIHISEFLLFILTAFSTEMYAYFRAFRRRKSRNR